MNIFIPTFNNESGHFPLCVIKIKCLFTILDTLCKLQFFEQLTHGLLISRNSIYSNDKYLLTYITNGHSKLQMLINNNRTSNQTDDNETLMFNIYFTLFLINFKELLITKIIVDSFKSLNIRIGYIRNNIFLSFIISLSVPFVELQIS